MFTRKAHQQIDKWGIPCVLLCNFLHETKIKISFKFSHFKRNLTYILLKFLKAQHKFFVVGDQRGRGTIRKVCRSRTLISPSASFLFIIILCEQKDLQIAFIIFIEIYNVNLTNIIFRKKNNLTTGNGVLNITELRFGVFVGVTISARNNLTTAGDHKVYEYLILF